MITSILAGGATYLKAREELDELLDYDLSQVAHAFSHQEKMSPLLTTGFSEKELDIAVQVWEGDVILSSIPKERAIPLQPDGISSVSADGSYWRVFVKRSGTRAFQVSQPIEARRELGVNFALRSIAPMLLAIPFLALFIWLSIRGVLRPLTRIADEVSRRSPTALDRIQLNALPAEVIPLVGHLNLLLEKLSHAITVQNRFVADAAHELRTPLAAVGLQLHVLERSDGDAERAEALHLLKKGIDRNTRLVCQLLALARIEPEAPRHFSTVALTELSRVLVAERAGIAMGKGVDLGLADSEEVTVTGEEEALGSMIGNLIDNAVRYTPAGGRVDVAVRRRGHDAVFEVVDTGPGIPRSEWERAFERFSRLGGDCSGSGLGLAIVKTAVDRHGGTVTLGTGEAGKGLRVVIVIPSHPL